VREVAEHTARHLLLLTATPHSGIEDSFQSLLGLLNPPFAHLDLSHLTDKERDLLARHFVQRRRADVVRWLGEDTPFPQRQSAEVTYALPRSSPYRALFDDVYRFARELVRDEQQGGVSAQRRRVRYWAALALLRCVMSSPAAAEKALKTRADTRETLPDPATSADHDDLWSDEVLSRAIHDSTDQEGAQDTEPIHVVEQGSPASERARLRRFAARAADLCGDGDPKLLATVTLVSTLLRDGFRPIVYCRYIATATYLAAELTRRISSYGTDLRILSVTGERSEEEREALVAELSSSPHRVLVATDCLSEGINLQQAFDAVVHYDLPWNPNRLEQREGRVDRYGQQRSVIRTALIRSPDNPIDEAVMQVLLRKAVHIHRTLGISVPLPLSSEAVMETLIGTLFEPQPEQISMFETAQQMSLLDADVQVQAIEQQWDAAVEREQESRTRFAQRRIKPDEVARELEESDAVLGNPATVERFVRGACERLGAPLQPGTPQQTFTLPLSFLPEAVRERARAAFALRPGAEVPDTVTISFDRPAPEGTWQIGRNHPLTEALSDYLLETALTPELLPPDTPSPAARSGLIRTRAVAKRTIVLLLRVRMLIQRDTRQTPLLAEELVVSGFTRAAGTIHWLDEDAARILLEQAEPAANVTPDERTVGIDRALEQVHAQVDALNRSAEERAERLRAAHQRVRQVTGGGRVTVRPHLPPDVLGVYVLLPLPHEENP
jgi:hypothetical protein